MPIDQQQRALFARAAKVERLRRDFGAFCESQLWIRPKRGPICRLGLTPPQKLIEHVIERQIKERGWIRLCEFKCRQHGGSTHAVARAAHRTFLNENVSTLIIAHDDAATENLFNMAGLYYDGMDADIRPVRRFLTKQEIVLENPDVKTRPDFPGLRSRINIQSAKNVHAGVGTTRNFVHLSEFCRFGNVKDLMGSLLPAIPMEPGTFIINESAPFGYGEGRDQFREWCDRSRSGKDQYAFVAVYWWMCPDYVYPLDKGEVMRLSLEEKRLIKLIADISRKELGQEIALTPEQLKYRRMQIEQLGRGDLSTGEALFAQQFASDYDSAWVTFDALVFDQYRVREMRKKYETGPQRRCEYEPLHDEFFDVKGSAPLLIWEDPMPGEIYDIGVDSATGNGGVGAANSVAEVFKRSNNEQVAEFASNDIKPLDFAKLLYSLGMYYNQAHMIVEVENVGYVVNEDLNQKGYPNVYRWRKRDHAGGGQLSVLTGWKTQFDSKKILVSVTNHAIAHDEIIIHSSALYQEMGKFIQLYTESDNERFVAQEGQDDRVMAMMIAQTGRRDEIGIELPMEKGAKLDRVVSFEERNALLQKGIQEQKAFYYNGDVEGPDRNNDDPFDRLARAMRNEQ